MSIKNRDFIIVGQQAWDYPAGSNCINIASEIAKNNRVLYVNPPQDWMTLWRKREDELYIIDRRRDILAGKRPALEKVNDNLHVLSPLKVLASINMLPDGAFYDMANKRNNKRLAAEIKRALAELNFEDVILFNDGDMLRSYYLPELLRPAFSIYYSRDYFRAVDYWKKHGSRLEPALMHKSDLVVSNSLYLNKLAAEYNSNTAYIGQGCDFDYFAPEKVKEIPEDLQKIGRPRIGYIGALLKLRLDIALIYEVAVKKPEWQIVLIGPEDEHFRTSALHELENVHFPGARPMQDLASYLQGFDIAFNPQQFNEVTIGNYPRKIDEYLAMGKPTVATRTETMEAFEGFVYLCEGADDYIAKIEQALREDNAEVQKERREFALQHSWENSVGELYSAIKNSPKYHGT